MQWLEEASEDSRSNPLTVVVALGFQFSVGSRAKQLCFLSRTVNLSTLCELQYIKQGISVQVSSYSFQGSPENVARNQFIATIYPTLVRDLP